MNHRHVVEIKIEKTFEYLVGNQVFMTNANEEEFEKAFDFVKTVNKVGYVMLENVLRAGGFHVKRSSQSYTKTFIW